MLLWDRGRDVARVFGRISEREVSLQMIVLLLLVLSSAHADYEFQLSEAEGRAGLFIQGGGLLASGGIWWVPEFQLLERPWGDSL